MSSTIISALEAAMQALDAKLADCRDDKIQGMARAMIRGYAHHWEETDKDWRAVSVEEEFLLPIVNPNASKISTSRTFNFGGKIDLVLFHKDRPELRYVWDHKTSSEDIGDPNGVFWKKLLLDPQPSAYMLAKWNMGEKLNGCIWDVVKKPGIRPKKVPKKERAELVSTGLYCGQRISDETVRFFEFGNEANVENAELYEARCFHDIMENPNEYYVRRTIPRDDSALVEYATQQWNVATNIRQAKRDKLWPMTGAPSACFTYQRACEFLDICTKHDMPTSHRWREKSRQHNELDLQDQSLPVLTNSSIQTFHQCQRKYFYKYEMCIEPALDMDSEALYFGSVFHAALEAYWNHLLAN